jgi:hypothetical protein
MSGVDVADTRARIVPTAMLVALTLLVLISWLLSPKPRPVVVVYGDSLTVQSESDVRSLHRTSGEHIVFTGNTASCAAAAFRTGGVAGATALYERSLREMRAIFPRLPITLVIPPAMHNLPHGWYPYNGNAGLVAMYKRVGAQLHMTINTLADDWLTPGHVFTATRPAYPHGPPVLVRLSDGVHLTDAGELWYGAALLD